MYWTLNGHVELDLELEGDLDGFMGVARVGQV